MRAVDSIVDVLVKKLKRRQIVGSFACAKETLLVLRYIVSQSRWTSLKQLISTLKAHGAKLAEAQPVELAVGNVVRRVLHMIREEYHVLVNDEQPERLEKKTLMDMFATQPKVDYDTVVGEMRPMIIQEINTMIDELESLYANIANQATDHIHSNEIIMTFGRSKTVEEFLRAAHRKRKFSVIVAEGAPLYNGQELAVSLAKAGIDCTLIADSAIYAVMSRVNKVILGTNAVLANGGLLSKSGSRMMAAAAKYHHVPLVVTCGLYKLSPLYPYDEINLLVNPAEDFQDVDDSLNPFFDYIEPEMVSLFVTNLGGHAPSYIYRLLGENYHMEDYELETEEVDVVLEERVRSSSRISLVDESI